MDTFFTTAGAVTLVWAVVNFVKYIKAGDVNGWLTQLAVWVAGVLVTFGLAETDFASNFKVGELTLAVVNGWTKLFAGLGLGALAMAANEVKQALDRSDSAVKPPLVGPEPNK